MRPGGPRTDGEGPEPRSAGRIGLLGGLFLFAVLLLAPAPEGLTPEAWRVAALGVLMATWWMTEAVPLPVTALLPLPLLPALGVASVDQAAAPFANPVIFLFMGGFMLGAAIQRWGLHRRIALGIIGRTGTAPRRLVAGFIVASAFLSMWVSNTAVAVMMLPVGVSVLEVVAGGPGRGGTPPGDPAFARALLLGIAYGASVGGLATLVGTPPNALLAGFLQETYGIRLGFGEWMLIGLPVTLAGLPIVWFVLTRVAFRVDPTGPALPASAMQALRSGLGTLSAAERRTAWIFAFTAVAWITRPLVERVVPGLTDAGIAIGATLFLFTIPAGGQDRGALLDWETARRIPWDILLLFGGGLSLAAAIASTGLAGWIGSGLEGAARIPLPLLLLLVTALLVLLTELTSNTASAAAFLPVVGAVAVALHLDPLLLTVPAALAASCAFMLPVATPPNAIVFGSHWIGIGHMMRAGLVLNVMFTLLIPVVAFLLVGIVFSP